MYADVREYVNTCDTCLRSKRNFAFRATPLHPLEPASYPFQVWAMDHKVLSRSTKEGNVGIPCCIDSFSCWPVLRAVPDFTAITTAKIFFQDIVPQLIITDKAQSFTVVVVVLILLVVGLFSGQFLILQLLRQPRFSFRIL